MCHFILFSSTDEFLLHSLKANMLIWKHQEFDTNDWIAKEYEISLKKKIRGSF